MICVYGMSVYTVYRCTCSVYMHELYVNMYLCLRIYISVFSDLGYCLDKQVTEGNVSLDVIREALQGNCMPCSVVPQTASRAK